MTDLSPAAQAVWDAYELVDCDEFKIDPRQAGLAAALEAAADQVVPRPAMIPEGGCTYEQAYAAAFRYDIRRKLLAIAAELRGKDQQHKEDNR